MRFLAVDDEPNILEELRETLERARPAAVNRYHGGNPPQYSWAEFRNGSLGFRDRNV